MVIVHIDDEVWNVFKSLGHSWESARAAYAEPRENLRSQNSSRLQGEMGG